MAIVPRFPHFPRVGDTVFRLGEGGVSFPRRGSQARVVPLIEQASLDFETQTSKIPLFTRAAHERRSSKRGRTMSMSRKHAWLVSANKARLMGLALAFALVPAPRVRAQSDESNDRITIVHGGTLLQVPGQPPQERRSIVILNDRIDRVMSGYVTADSLDFDDAEVIDLRDYFVLPGLMDMHVHFTKRTSAQHRAR